MIRPNKTLTLIVTIAMVVFTAGSSMLDSYSFAAAPAAPAPAASLAANEETSDGDDPAAGSIDAEGASDPADQGKTDADGGADKDNSGGSSDDSSSDPTDIDRNDAADDTGDAADTPDQETPDQEEIAEEESDQSLTDQKITARLVAEELYENASGTEKTPAYKGLNRFWKNLMGRDALTGETADLEVTVSGMLPEGAAAEARWIPMDEGLTHSEQGLASLKLTIYDKEGRVYIPKDPVNVRIKGDIIRDEIRNGSSMLVYSYRANKERAEEYSAAYDKKIYAADVAVFRDGTVDDRRLQYETYDENKRYEAGKDAVRYFEDGAGLTTEASSVSLDYDFHAKAGSPQADEDAAAAADSSGVSRPAYKSANLVITAQKPVRTLKSRVGRAVITVRGPLDKEVGLKATEITEKDKTYQGYVDETAARMGKDTEELAFARAFDIQLIDPATGQEFQPDSQVKVSIQLRDEDLSDQDMEVDVVHFADASSDGAAGASGSADAPANAASSEGADKAALGSPDLMDAEVSGSTIKFDTDAFSVYVVAGYTVDFHWGDYTYKLEGGSEIFLTELLKTLAESGAEGRSEEETSRLRELSEDISLVKDVRFSDPDLIQVDQVSIVEPDDAKDPEDETDGNVTEAAGKKDWRLWSLKAFDTQETLTITLADGSRLEIPTTDERVNGTASGSRVTADGVTYTLTNGTGNGTSTTSNEGDGKTYNGRATVYAISAGCTVHNEIQYGSNLYKVWNIAASSNNLTGIGMKMDRKFVNRAAGHSFTLPEMKTDVSPEEKAAWAADGFVAGSANDAVDDTPASNYKFWKKATYNPDTNSIDYEIKYFQAMKEDVPLDFIFIYDDSITMYTGDRGAPTNNGANNSNETVIREAQGTRIMILSAAQALMADDAGYDIRMAMGGASNGDNRRSSWYSKAAGYTGVETYLSKYATGATSHTTGLNNALTLARQSVQKNRQPIVVYLSDFKDGGSVASFRTTANALHNIARVYGLSTTNNENAARLVAIASDSSAIFTMSEISDGVRQLENIVKDAIGYFMKEKVTVTDNLSEAISGQTATNGSSTTGNTSGKAGSNTWTLGGTSPYPGSATVYTESFSAPLDPDTIYAGSMPTNGSATVYVGGKKENDILPKDEDPDDLHLAQPLGFMLGKLNEKNRVIADGNGIPANLVTGTVQFTLTEKGSSDVIDTYTVGSDGSFSIPFKKDNKVILELNKEYTLQEVESSVASFNASANPQLIAPDKAWTIKVAANGIVTVTPETGAGQTPEATKAKPIAGDPSTPARIVLWNQITVPAELIPIKVRKTWNSNEHLDDVKISIYGIPMTINETTGNITYGTRQEDPLPVYSGDQTSSARVQYLTADNSEVTTVDGKTVWTKTVYVPDSITEEGTKLKFYDADKLTQSELQAIVDNHHALKINGTNYTPEQLLNLYGTTIDGVKKLVCNQKYSYEIREGDLVYENGWYTPEYTDSDAADAISNDVYIGEWSEGSKEKTEWLSYTETDDDQLQLHLNFSNFEYDSSNSDRASFRSWLGYDVLNTRLKLSTFYSKLDSIIIGVYDSKAKVYYKLKFGEGTVTKPYSTTAYYVSNDGASGSIYTNLPMPSAWSSYGSDGSRGKRVNNLSIKSISVTAKGHTDHPFMLYGTDPETGASANTRNSFPNGPDANENRRTEIELKDTTISIGNLPWYTHPYGNRYKNFTTVKDASVTKKVVTPAVPSKQEGLLVLSSCTLGIENTWTPNPLIPITVVKNWKIDEDADSSTPASDYATDTYNAKQDVTFSLKGTNESGATKSVSIFTPASDSETDVNAMKTAWNTNGTGGAATGTIAKTDANKDQAEWNKTFYVPTYDMSTYKRTLNADGTETVTGPEEFTYTKTEPTDAEKMAVAANLTEDEFTVGKDDDEQPKGKWAEVEKEFAAGSTTVVEEINTPEGWQEYTPSSTKTIYLQIDPNRVTINNFRGIRFEYTSNGVQYRMTYAQRSGTAGTTLAYNKMYYLPFVVDSAFVANATISKYEYYTNAWKVPPYAICTLYADKPSGTLISLDSTATYNFEKYSEGEYVPGSTTIIPATFTLTNTYTPYKEVRLSSAFSDASEDQASTAQVKKVIYTIKDSNGDVVRTTDMAMEDGTGASGTTVRKSYFQPAGGTKRNYKSIYLPKGSYTISQSYTLDSGDSAKQYALDGSLDAYDVTYKVGNGSSVTGPFYATDGNEKAQAVTIDSDREISFTNTRKTMPIRVTMDWEPGLTEDEDPLKLTDKTIPYKISYDTYNTSANPTEKGTGNYTKKYKTSNSGAETSNNLTDADFNLEYARQTNDHAAGIPTYSVREMLTQCDFSYTEGEGSDAVEKNYLEEVLPDYDCNVKQEEIDSNNDGKKDTMVFTIEAHIKRADVIIEKNFDAAFDFEKYKGSTITYTLKRSDGKKIYGTDTDEVKLVMHVPSNTDPGTMSGTMALNATASAYCDPITEYYSDLDAKTRAVYENDEDVYLPILRSSVDIEQKKDASGNPVMDDNGDPVMVPVKYIVSEAVAKAGVPQYYFPSFTDQSGDADHRFEQTNPAGMNIDTSDLTPSFGKANTAKFILNPAGIIIGVGNAETPYICKIVETFGSGESRSEVENPFRTLNEALAFARANGNGQAMGPGNPVRIEMLVDYEIPGTSSDPTVPVNNASPTAAEKVSWKTNDRIVLSQSNDNIIITTAPTSGGVYNFTPTFAEGTAAGDRLSTDSKETAILKRKSNFEKSLFTVQATNASLRTENIIFEGADISTSASGSIIFAEKGSLTIAGNTTVRNAKSAGASNNGGAIRTQIPVTFTTEQGETILFKNCTTAGKDGGVIETEGKKLTIDNKGTLKAENCSASSGGFICTDTGGEVEISNSGTIDVTRCTSTSTSYGGGAIWTGNFKAENNSGNISFINCTSAGKGGAIVANRSDASEDTFVLTNTATGTASFTNCTAKDGGAVYVTKGKCTITGANVGNPVTFEGCTASSNGGAIYQADGNALTLTNVTFGKAGIADSGCKAALEGGCIYSKGKEATLTDCDFYYGIAGAANESNKTRGGAIYFEGETSLSISGCAFDHCSARTNSSSGLGYGNGGAVFINSKAALTVEKSSSQRRSSFTDCFGHRFGGAVMYEIDGGDGGTSVSISGTDFTGCYTEIRGGGAICTDSNQTTIDDCTFRGCYDKSSSGGGAIQLHPDKDPGTAPSCSISDSTFEDCYTASGNGGAIYGCSPDVPVTLENVSINGHTTGKTTSLAAGTANATSGAAIYSKGNLTIRQTGTGTSEIKNCSASGDKGGAVNLDNSSGDKPKMFFEGTVVISGNTNTAYDTGNEHNVILDKNNNTTIYTTDRGLGQNADIGVYVTGSNADPYNSHGKEGKPFGTWGAVIAANGTISGTKQGTGDANLFRFTNDRNNCWGVKRGEDGLIYWNDPIVKVTDKDNVLLYELKVDNDGTADDLYLPAVYETLNGGLTAARGTLYTLNGTTYTPATAMDTSNLRKMKMLKDYVIPGTDRVTLNQSADNIVMTTAETTAPTAADTYIFNPTFTTAQGRLTADSKSTAILKRGDFTDASLFDATNASAKIAFRNITLDGDRENREVTVPGGLVHSAGTVEVQSGTTMRNTKTSGRNSDGYGGGGAIWAKDVAINDNTGTIRFDNCFANYSGGAIYYTHHFDMNNNTGSIIFNDCSMNDQARGDGGAISNWVESNSGQAFSATNNSGSIEFINCRAENNYTQGGAIFQHSGGPITLASTGNGSIRFSGCYAGAGTDENCGGAISAWNSNVTISLTGTAMSPIVFENCYAKTGNGGAIYTPGNVVLTNVRFGGYKTDANGNYVDSDGNALSSGEKPVVDSALACRAEKAGKDGKYYGGAVCAGGSVTYTSTAGASYTGCYGSYGSSGGAIYAGSVSLNDNSGTLNFDGCYTTGSDAHGGAVRADNGVTMNSNSGNIKFKDCHSGTENRGDADGGAIAVYGSGSLSATNNTGTIRFENCSTSTASNRQGGAFIVLKGSITMESKGGGAISFKNCSSNEAAETVSGGAICLWTNGTGITLTGTASHPIVFEDCHSSGMGGAIGSNSGNAVNLTYVNIDGHTTGNPTSLAAGTVNATKGGAIYSKGNLKIVGGEIKNCSASDTNGGAVQVDDGKTMTFEGNVVIYDNKSEKRVDGESKKVQANVVLDHKAQNDYNAVIRTTGNGLGGRAHIGVYVVGNNAEPYSGHGNAGQPFATAANSNTDGGLKNVKRFTNDRHYQPEDLDEDPPNEDFLYGVKGENEGDTLIYWKAPDGSRKVILRKVGGNYDPASERTFTIHKGGTLIEGTDIAGRTVTTFTSGASGVFFIGELTFGTYTVTENGGKTVSFTVGENGITTNADKNTPKNEFVFQ